MAGRGNVRNRTVSGRFHSARHGSDIGQERTLILQL